MSAPASSVLTPDAIAAVNASSKVVMDAWAKEYKAAHPDPLGDRAAVLITPELTAAYNAWHAPYAKAYKAKKWKVGGILYTWQREAYLEATLKLSKGRPLCANGHGTIQDVEALCKFRVGDKVVVKTNPNGSVFTVQDRMIDWSGAVKVVTYDTTPVGEPTRIIMVWAEGMLELYKNPEDEAMQAVRKDVVRLNTLICGISATPADGRNPIWRDHLAVALKALESLHAISEPATASAILANSALSRIFGV